MQQQNSQHVACEVSPGSVLLPLLLCKVSALCCAGGEQNLILLDRSTHKPSTTGTVGWAGSTFGPLHKSRVGDHEFEALMRTLDNLVGVTAALHFRTVLHARFLFGHDDHDVHCWFW